MAEGAARPGGAPPPSTSRLGSKLPSSCLLQAVQQHIRIPYLRRQVRHTRALTRTHAERARLRGRLGQVSGSGSFNMSVAHHDKYYAYLMVCGRDMSFHGEVTSTFINLDPEGGLTQHLPIELAMLPAIHSVSTYWLAVFSRSCCTSYGHACLQGSGLSFSRAVPSSGMTEPRQ